MEIDEAHFDRRIELGENAIGGAERAIRVRHVGAALQIENCALFPDDHPTARRFGRIIGGSQKARCAAQIIVDLALVPDVIACGEHIDPQFEQVLGNQGRDAEAACGILPVGDSQVDLLRFDDVLQVVGDNAAPRGGEDVADE